MNNLQYTAKRILETYYRLDTIYCDITKIVVAYIPSKLFVYVHPNGYNMVISGINGTSLGWFKTVDELYKYLDSLPESWEPTGQGYIGI